MQYKNKRRFILGISIVLLIVLYLFKNISLLIRVGGTIFGLWLFYFLDHSFEIKFKLRHYLYMFLILFVGILFSPLYSVSGIYDKILHLTMPLFGGMLIFFVVDKLKIKFQWKLLITLTSLLSVLVIHEIGEYLIDLLWDLNLQGVYIRSLSGLEKFDVVQNKIDDTMIDMILGFFSALIFVVAKTICYFYNNKCKILDKKRD